MLVYLDNDRKDKTRELWNHAFPEDGESFLNYYYQEKCRDNKILCDIEEGMLRGMIHFNPYPVWLRGQVLDSCYLVAVAVRQEYRHRGIMAAMLKKGLTDLHIRQVPFVFLMPIAKEIYLPFGFRYIYQKPKSPVFTGDIRRILPAGFECCRAETENYKALADLWQERLQERYDCFPIRDAIYIGRLQKECESEGGELLEIRKEGRLAGMAAWWGTEPSELREFFITGREDAPAEKEYKIMGRITCVQAFLEEFEAEKEERLILQILDDLIEGNAGIYRWEIGPGISRAERCFERPDWTVKAEELMMWLMGNYEKGKIPGGPVSEETAEKIRKVKTVKNLSFTEVV